MFAVIYRWRIDPDREADFLAGWELVSGAVRDRFGSLGSRLHLADDGLYVAYGRWFHRDDRLPYRAHLDFHDEGWRLMQSAIIEELPEIPMTVVEDMLSEPPSSLPPRKGRTS
ncbi:antibiotic biosynthesis monooxygenase family protein [Jatrophihabitans lederbergiae]|jgi:hypothetical protein|uniref:Antibiotic biosynthesis monooxygenase n=1 Tax=Jatrophihabitans lederbergiae TaxID=3075547 RepID=A0ABU2J9V1_9ACTN|nr:hypothetical protein [Jatrophihabitans sp. DSM 44399]MDT0261765.1 hypothetical protein [Jatrophihabitans sp. DSM 44399]